MASKNVLHKNQNSLEDDKSKILSEIKNFLDYDENVNLSENQENDFFDITNKDDEFLKLRFKKENLVLKTWIFLLSIIDKFNQIEAYRKYLFRQEEYKINRNYESPIIDLKNKTFLPYFGVMILDVYRNSLNLKKIFENIENKSFAVEKSFYEEINLMMQTLEQNFKEYLNSKEYEDLILNDKYNNNDLQKNLLNTIKMQISNISGNFDDEYVVVYSYYILIYYITHFPYSKIFELFNLEFDKDFKVLNKEKLLEVNFRDLKANLGILFSLFTRFVEFFEKKEEVQEEDEEPEDAFIKNIFLNYADFYISKKNNIKKEELEDKKQDFFNQEYAKFKFYITSLKEVILNIPYQELTRFLSNSVLSSPKRLTIKKDLRKLYENLSLIRLSKNFVGNEEILKRFLKKEIASIFQEKEDYLAKLTKVYFKALFFEQDFAFRLFNLLGLFFETVYKEQMTTVFKLIINFVFVGGSSEYRNKFINIQNNLISVHKKYDKLSNDFLDKEKFFWKEKHYEDSEKTDIKIFLNENLKIVENIKESLIFNLQDFVELCDFVIFRTSNLSVKKVLSLASGKKVKSGEEVSIEGLAKNLVSLLTNLILILKNSNLLEELEWDS